MARVQTFPKSKLKLAELQAVGHAIENQILSANTDVTEFKSQFDEYQSALAVFDSSLLKLTKSNWTSVMKELKTKRTKLRSNAFSNIRSFEIFSLTRICVLRWYLKTIPLLNNSE